MNFQAKKVLFIDLAHSSYEVKSFPDLVPFLGGVGVGLKLYELYAAQDPVIFSIGPLNGFFPFVSKTSIVLDNDGVVEDIYIGGSLSFRLAFSGVDAIVLLGKSAEPVTLDVIDDTASFDYDPANIFSLGLPGKKSTLVTQGSFVVLDNFFTTPLNILNAKFVQKNITGMVVTGSHSYSIDDMTRYAQAYREILGRNGELSVGMGSSPSCSGCPMGCDKSRVGEAGGNILSHCLVACDYAQSIYSDVNIVFSCLNVLGYDYRHEDLEQIPSLVEEVLKRL